MNFSSFRLVAISCFWLALIGADCSPTERACQYVGDPACSTDPMNREYPACINFCVEAGEVDDPCYVDPCLTVEIGGARICPGGMTCQPEAAGELMGRCVLNAPLATHECEPDAFTTGVGLCSTGTICRSFDCPNFDRTLFPWLDVDAPGMCVLPIREGGLCDSSWGEVGCLTCEAGTECLPDPRRGGVLICQRRCGDDDDCPCGPGAEGGITGDYEAGCLDGGLCAICHRNGAECRNPNDPEHYLECVENPSDPACDDIIAAGAYPCCDPFAECADVDENRFPVGESGLRVCCRPEMSGCANDDECCPGSSCFEGSCQECDLPGEAHSGNEEENTCCFADAGNEENGDGVCAVPCADGPDGEDPGDPCGEECNGMFGEWTCSPTAGGFCDMSEIEGDDEECNGGDDDCDGRIDEGLASDATDAYATANCIADLPMRCNGEWEGGTLGGVEVCIDGEEVCVPRPGIDFCGRDDIGWNATYTSGVTNCVPPAMGAACGAYATFTATSCTKNPDGTFDDCAGYYTTNFDQSACGPYEQCQPLPQGGGMYGLELCPSISMFGCGRCTRLSCGEICWEPGLTPRPHDCP